MAILREVLTYVLWFYLLLLIGRMIVSWIQMFAHSWQPTGVVLVVAEVVFTVTDPPLKFLGRYIHPLKLGTVSVDLSFMVLYIVILILLEAVVPRL